MNLKKAKCKVKKFVKENEVVIVTGTVIAGVAIAGGIVGYKIKVKSSEKAIDSFMNLVTHGCVVESKVTDTLTGTVTTVVSMTPETVKELIQIGMEGIK